MARLAFSLFALCSVAAVTHCGSGSTHTDVATNSATEGDGATIMGAVSTSSSGGAQTDDGADGSSVVVDDAGRVPTSPADAGRPPADPCVAADNCPKGTWINVTPAGIDLNQSDFNGDNYGMQDVLIDPARASDFYALTTHQGVWKSTNYGQTWTGPINTGANGSLLKAGKQWCGAIANASSATPPTIWTCNGNGQAGVWKSTDGGVSWTNYQTLPAALKQDIYSLVVDPYDANHLLTGFHEVPGVASSSDGGKTWSNVTGNLNASGISFYPFFIDTGNAATTATTWIAVPEGTGGMVGTWRTTNGGAQWAQVEKVEHPHGSCQISQVNGVIYLAGQYGSKGSGAYRSTDFGATWTYDKQPGYQAGVAWQSPKNVYSMIGFPQTAPSWESTTQPGTGTWAGATTPAGMTAGPKTIATGFDGTNYIFVGGMWGAGLWRYVEP
jgi:hypothetical protein